MKTPLTLVTLVLKRVPSFPVEAESINPENVTGKEVEGIKSLPLWCGNRREEVGDYFDVEIENSGQPAQLVLKGDLSRFKRLGQGMGAGEMIVGGSVGFHAGALMRGGTLVIKGDAGDWLGAHMENGLIKVEGSAGDFVGAAYRGKNKGMTGGTILITGNAGQMLGARMRRGLIAIGGDCGDMMGFGMLAGTVLVRGRAGILAGAKMVRGTVILLQPQVLLPTFYYNCTCRLTTWSLLYKHLNQAGFLLPAPYQDILFRRYSGDANEGGRGEILICHCP
ncbi:MAG: formylmethanofuran dehydrogenase subunit C [Desulfosporosinus sp.]|nr:formylmethanofuran dehydrogenase subunit C [Desulfosporosinus sp.]